MSYIKFENLYKSFGSNEVLKDINLEIEQGQLVTLLGPSGCGKSTLLRCLAGLETVTSGKVYLDGKDITNVDPKNRGIGMVFQQYSLFPNMNVLQNVKFGLAMKKVDKALADKKSREILEVVGLGDKLKQYPSQLSGGQQQRAALARAIVTEPKVLLLDEPLSAIDALLRHSLQVEIRRIQRDLGITAIFVTHDQEEAMVMSDMIHLMYKGQIEQSAKPTDLYTKPRTSFVASFIGHYNLFDAATMKKLTGEAVDCENVAFRPEIIGISRTPVEKENAFLMKGTVNVSLPHGNILRYAVMCGDIQVDVDVLFGQSELFEAGDEVYLAVSKPECIYL
ncbi:MAG: ABC transporter ATP-binding protein [Lachnospiraceae bacterium]|nr:ABC transporter ATP-binding protein [Lachnospiraceae bacterium]